MVDIHKILSTCNPLQRMIFVGAMYLTAPAYVPADYLEKILEEVTELEGRLTTNELARAREAVQILIKVDGFPSLSHEELADFLQGYELDEVNDTVKDSIEGDMA